MTDTESKLLPDIYVYSRRETDPTAAFLHRLTEKYDVSDAEFLSDGCGYLINFVRHNLSGQFNYKERNLIEKSLPTFAMRIDRLHTFWHSNPSSSRRWLQWFGHYYNHDRANQALSNRTPAGEVLN